MLRRLPQLARLDFILIVEMQSAPNVRPAPAVLLRAGLQFPVVLAPTLKLVLHTVLNVLWVSTAHQPQLSLLLARVEHILPKDLHHVRHVQLEVSAHHQK